ncbi:hypothetical protein RYX36_006968, partial [Vicia faba]
NEQIAEERRSWRKVHMDLTAQSLCSIFLSCSHPPQPFVIPKVLKVKCCCVVFVFGGGAVSYWCQRNGDVGNTFGDHNF